MSERGLLTRRQVTEGRARALAPGPLALGAGTGILFGLLLPIAVALHGEDVGRGQAWLAAVAVMMLSAVRLAQLVAWGETREAAIAELDRALGGTTIAPATTNIAFLRKVLRSEEFCAGRYDTKFAEVFAKRP